MQFTRSGRGWFAAPDTWPVTGRPSLKGDDMREDDRRRIANGGSGLAGQAFCESLIALTGRMRAFLHELEAYEGIPVGTDAGPLLAAFAEVLGSNDGTG